MNHISIVSKDWDTHLLTHRRRHWAVVEGTDFTTTTQYNHNDKDKIIEVKIIMTGRKMREKARYAEAKVCQVL